MAHAESVVAHHFDTAEQQYEAAQLGMWVFLVTEIMFFGGLFGAYTVYRSMYPDIFAEASTHMDITLGAINTAVLICSSLTMALAVRSAQLGKSSHIVWFLVLTMILGSVFLGIKGVEYHHKWVEHLIPGPNFSMEGSTAREAQILFSLYFAMTGMHAFHMIIGIGLLTVIAVLAARGKFSPAYFSPVEISGLYWHFVDIVWIFLFPLLYLIGAHHK